MSDQTTFRLRALGLLGFLGFCVAVFAMLWRFGGGDVDPVSDPYHVEAVVPTAIALAEAADVRHAGVRIGSVTGVAQRGDRAVLRLELDDEHAPAYRDATVRVRTKTLSGENYVALDPGTPAAGRVPDGGTLPLEQAEASVQLDEVLSTLDPPRRRALRRLLDGAGAGLRGREADLNRFLEATSAGIREGADVVDVLHADRAQVASLVDDVGRVGRALGDRRDAVAVLARRARVLAEATADRDERLRETLDELPGFLRTSRATTARLGAVATTATPVVRDLADASAELVPAVRLLRPTAASTRRTMRALDGFDDVATPLVRDLAPFARAATRVAGPLEAFLREANPLVAHLAPYAIDLGGVLGMLRNGQETTDALGHYARVVALVSKSSAFGALTPEQEAQYQTLTKAGVLRQVDRRGRNPYPRPGTAFAPEPQGAYPRLEREPPYRP